MESPYAGEANLAYAKRCIHDCLKRGEAPIASHLLFTQPGILDDSNPEERAWGMAAGHAWICVANAVVCYLDLGMSKGMIAGRNLAVDHNIPVEYRTLS